MCKFKKKNQIHFQNRLSSYLGNLFFCCEIYVFKNDKNNRATGILPKCFLKQEKYVVDNVILCDIMMKCKGVEKTEHGGNIEHLESYT